MRASSDTSCWSEVPTFLETEKWPIVELRAKMSSFEFLLKVGNTVILQQTAVARQPIESLGYRQTRTEINV